MTFRKTAMLALGTAALALGACAKSRRLTCRRRQMAARAAVPELARAAPVRLFLDHSRTSCAASAPTVFSWF